MDETVFEIANPWILTLIPLPILVWFIIPASKPKQLAGLRIPFFKDIQAMSQQSLGSQYRFKFAMWLLWLIWALLVFAASGPQWVGKAVALPRSGRDIMLAIDVSGSMVTKDMNIGGQPVDRLQAIKAIATEFIKHRKGDRLGLILFGTKAYLQTPLTYDRKTVEHMLQDASIGLAGTRTAIGDAIGLAIKRLIKFPKDDRILILLTDGVNNAGNVNPLSAAKMAAKYGVKIYTIGFGANQAIATGMFGRQVINPSVELDEKTLKQIAKMTGGLYFRATDTASLQKVYETINKIEPTVSDKGVFRPIEPLYPWPLGIAFGFSILLMLWPLLRRIGVKRNTAS